MFQRDVSARCFTDSKVTFPLARNGFLGLTTNVSNIKMQKKTENPGPYHPPNPYFYVFEYGKSFHLPAFRNSRDNQAETTSPILPCYACLGQTKKTKKNSSPVCAVSPVDLRAWCMMKNEMFGHDMYIFVVIIETVQIK